MLVIYITTAGAKLLSEYFGQSFLGIFDAVGIGKSNETDFHHLAPLQLSHSVQFSR